MVYLQSLYSEMYASFSSTDISFSAALHFSYISGSNAEPLRSFALHSHAEVPLQELRKRPTAITEKKLIVGRLKFILFFFIKKRKSFEFKRIDFFTLPKSHH